MTKVPGTKGYELVIDAFAKASFSLDFAEVNRVFVDYLPSKGGRVLDVGCGVGQNAAALANLGFKVVAAEPLPQFLSIAKARYEGLEITWINDSLPELSKIDSAITPFDFILIDGVWHHLSPEERAVCLQRFANLLAPGGVVAISLRNGPAGAGKHVFPTSVKALEHLAEPLGFETIFTIENQPSILPNKQDVLWSRVVIRL